MNSLKLVR